jgi:hypothetical protein
VPHKDQQPDLPDSFDRRNMRQSGVEVLKHGLPSLPEQLTYEMAIPVAYWTAGLCAVVLFLEFQHDSDVPEPVVLMGGYSCDAGSWAAHRNWFVTGWSDDPIANQGRVPDLDGRVIATSGGTRSKVPRPGVPAAVVHGRAAQVVSEIGLIQDGREDRRPLESHFGAWVICTERPGPFRITAYDKNGFKLDDSEES